jgi:hypothetical protein
MAKKLACASCGGTKKMKLGGSAVAKAPVNMYGIPQENMGTSSQMGFGRKGGTVTKIISTNRAVKTSCNNTKVRTASGSCAPERKPMMKSGGNTKKVLPKAQLGISMGQPRDSSAMKNAYDKKLTDAYYEEAKKKAFNNHKSNLNKIKQDNLIRQKTAALNTATNDYKIDSSTGKMKYVPSRKKGGTTKSFPDLNKDGKVTKADILVGKGVIPKAKSGGTAHPGFKAVQSKIAAKQGISKEAAGAILASSTRKASAKAKAANPRLKKVK